MPRAGERVATHATLRPVNANVAVAVELVAYFSAPPYAEVVETVVQVPPYVIDALPSCFADSVTVGPAAHEPPFLLCCNSTVPMPDTSCADHETTIGIAVVSSWPAAATAGTG